MFYLCHYVSEGMRCVDYPCRQVHLIVRHHLRKMFTIGAAFCGLLALSGYVNSLRTPLKRLSSTGARLSTKLNFMSPAALNIDKRTSGAYDAVTTLFSSKSEPVAGLGDDGCALPSPSGVNTLPLPAQAAVFFGYYLALYGGTTALVTGIDALKHSFPGPMDTWMMTWPILGPMFMAAGLSHFSMKDGFENIMPAQGAWGFWYIPGSKSFHVAWTGVVEFLAGFWLAIGAISKLAFGISISDAFQLGSGSGTADASLVLFALTLLVTPANIYMLTHGAKLPPVAMEPVPVAGHAARAVLQCILLAIFYEMAIPSIFFLQNLAV